MDPSPLRSLGRAICAAAGLHVFVCALAAGNLPVHAQAVRGTLLGSIDDSGGARCPGPL